jgi:hypothetical protein
VGKTGLTRGTHASAEDREKASRRKAWIKGESALLQLRQRRAQAEQLGPACGLQPAGEERPAGAGWAEGRVGRKVGQAESKEKEYSELKIRFLNLPRLWKFVGDLGGILTWGFFLNSSRLLKDFRKI